MNERLIATVASVLVEWNPLGREAKNIKDLDGYRVEAIDIIAGFYLHGGSGNLVAHVMNVLNQAFGIKLSLQDCMAPAQAIAAALAKEP